MAEKGYIYIMTNPSFEEYVKIGYATNVQQRLDELNRSTAVPFAFRIYATYEVDSALSDKKLHAILDKLNPDLRSMEEVNGKKRVREFYAMSPEDAYAILEAIAEINGYTHRLKKWKATAEERKEEQIAQEITDAHRERLAPFAFSMCKIAPGETITFACRDNKNDGAVCRVVDDRHVEYNGETWSLSSLAQFLTGKSPLQGPRYFKYNGEWLVDLRHRLEK
ncbi:MAG: GIY-YIG nuclease family protein [Oscillospiraceae bacterium]|nr:GIY-YIG nuclease family protein [Oscillospiraceae bacterium]